MLMKVLSLAAAIASLLVVLGGAARAASGPEITVEASGSAAANTPTTEKEALNAALRQAVEKAMGAQVTVELTVEKKQLVGEKILSRSEGFVKSYEITEKKTENDVYTVKIKAVVKNGELRNELAAIGLIMERKEKPRVMVLVSSRQSSETVATAGNRTLVLFASDEPTQQVTSAVEGALIAKGFNLVDARQDARRKQFELAVSGGDSKKVAALAADAGAELVVDVVATRNFREAKEVYGTTYRFYDSEVQIRAMRAGTGGVMCSVTKTGTPSATVAPMVDAAKAAANEAIENILKGWSSDVQNAQAVVLKVRKVDFGNLVKLKKAIEAIPGVDRVTQRAFGGGEATLEVDWSGGKVDDLGAAIAGVKDPVVEITGATQEVLDLEVKGQ